VTTWTLIVTLEWMFSVSL